MHDQDKTKNVSQEALRDAAEIKSLVRGQLARPDYQEGRNSVETPKATGLFSIKGFAEPGHADGEHDESEGTHRGHLRPERLQSHSLQIDTAKHIQKIS